MKNRKFNRNPEEITTDSLYDNVKMLSPDGKFMAYCDFKKAVWYVEKTGAVWIDDKSFQLKFTPKGPGDLSPIANIERLNACIVCNSNDRLSRHHIVPYMYTQWFPENLKTHASYDILGMCYGCHVKYENQHASKFKKHIFKEYDVSWHDERLSKVLKDNHHILAAQKLIRKSDPRIPKEKMEILTAIAMTPIKPIPEKDPSVGGREVVRRCQDLSEFIKRWRNHFLDTMKPHFLPQGWTTDYEYKK